MIHLHYSNLTEQLVTALVGNVQRQRQLPGFSPFDRVRIIVPNRNLATFLKYEFARRTGIAANLEFTYLNAFFRDAAVAEGVPIIRRQAVRDMLIGRFLDNPPGDIQNYLAYASDEDERDRRIFQISDRLSQLFEEYALARPRMIELWPNQPALDETQYRETERWQRELWLSTLGPEGQIAQMDPPGKTLPQYLAGFDASKRPAEIIHIFGLSYVARLYFDALNRLATTSEVFVYTVNPCMEYWEDVPSGWKFTKREKKRFEPRQQNQASMFDQERETLFSDDHDPPALRLWGRPGRENIKLLNELTNCDFEPHFEDPMLENDVTLLQRFQHDILVREPMKHGAAYAFEDESLVFLACPNIQREVEVVANEIWHLIESTADSDDPITFNDIAIVLNHMERDAYQSRIRSVFQDNHQIPFNMIDVAATGSRRFVEATALLLELPFSEFTRNEFLRLLSHPCVLAADEESDRELFVRWCDELNILHGADGHDHEGSYIDKPLFHWDQGLTRLVLGGFMLDQKGEDSVRYDVADVIPFELGSSELGAAQAFVAMARSMIADARFVREHTATMREWMVVIADMVTSYLHVVDDQDDFDRMRVLERIEELAESTVDGPKVHYRYAFEAVMETLHSLEVSRGHYLADGVAVSSFLPMRPIPFRVVFVTGMGEKHFPRPDIRSPLDLRWATTEPWDNFSARRQDEYMFLETLMSTRDRFYTSWVARDSYTGEELQPSSVVRELRFMLQQHYISNDEIARRTKRHPLRRFDRAYLQENAPGKVYQSEAKQEMKAALLRADVTGQSGQLPVRLSGFESRLSDPEWKELTSALGLMNAPPSEALSRSITQISLSQIRGFLKSPLQGSARFYLRLREDEDEDVLLRENELFETPTLTAFSLLRDTFLDSIATGADPRKLYETRASILEQKGDYPTGLFKQANMEKHLAILKQWHQNIGAFQIDAKTLTSFGLGKGDVRGGVIERKPALRLQVQGPHEPMTIRIVGTTAPISPTDRSAMRFTTSETLGDDWKEEYVHADAFVDYAVLTAAGHLDGPDFRLLLNANRFPNLRFDDRTFESMSQDAALGWLRGVVEDMLSGVHSYLLPIEGIFKHRIQTAEIPFEQTVDQMKSETYKRLAFLHGPVRHPERFDVPDDFERVIDRRLGLYFDLRRR